MRQLFMFKCERCGAANVACKNSGFEVEFRLTASESKWISVNTKYGAAVTAGGLSTDAGSGSTTSEPRVIGNR
jgi:hypothetical protein